MLAKVAPDSVNKWQWIYLNNACTRPENWPTANLRLVSATCAQYGVGSTLVGMLWPALARCETTTARSISAVCRLLRQGLQAWESCPIYMVSTPPAHTAVAAPEGCASRPFLGSGPATPRGGRCTPNHALLHDANIGTPLSRPWCSRHVL